MPADSKLCAAPSSGQTGNEIHGPPRLLLLRCCVAAGRSPPTPYLRQAVRGFMDLAHAGLRSDEEPAVHRHTIVAEGI